MADDNGATIEDWYREDRTFPPSPEFVARALVADPAIYERAAADPEAEAPTINLAFAWQPGMKAQVTSTNTRTRVADERTTRTVTSSHTLRVDPQGDRLRVRFIDPNIDLGNGAKALPADARAQLAAQVASLLPDYIVSKDGEFVTIHDLPAFQKRLSSFLKSVFPAETDSGALQQVEALLGSEEFLNAQAAQQWADTAGVLTDLTGALNPVLTDAWTEAWALGQQAAASFFSDTGVDWSDWKPGNPAAARTLAEREGLIFVEGIKPGPSRPSRPS